jgi:hypothetical protein
MRISLNPSKCSGFFKQVFLSKKFQQVLSSFHLKQPLRLIQAPKLKSIKLLPLFTEQKRIGRFFPVWMKPLRRLIVRNPEAEKA